jgi:heterodisulfide reductase subunit A
MVDMVRLAQEVKNFEGVVVVEENIHFCSEKGQSIIREKIKALGLYGIVIGSCSPKLHENTFRNVLKEAGHNPYLLEIANLREQVSWCSKYIEEATQKAIDLIFMKVKKVLKLLSLEEERMPVTKKALVIGAGIAGIEAALDLAKNGINVVLVERSPFIGGNMAKLDKTFPTLDCSACILAPKMQEVMNHPLIDTYCKSSITKVTGFVGNFTVSILQGNRGVDIKKCTGCGKCAERCPVRVASEFDEGVAERTAIYKPFPQALPKAPNIDRDSCLYFKTGKCKACSSVCPSGAIHYEGKDKNIEEKVGAIVVATGYEMFEAAKYTEYGFGRYTDVLTNLQFERMLDSSGPTGGKIIRPSDGKTPKKIVFVHCTGSRDINKGVSYCSKICCMVTAKHAAIAKDKLPDTDICSFYVDLRAGGKNYEEFIRQVAEAQVQFIKGRVSHIVKTGINYTIKAENVLLGEPVKMQADLVVLSSAMIPSQTSTELARVLGIAYDKYGFYQEQHPKLKPVSSSRAGIFLAGTCSGPMDISDSVSRAAASAEKILDILSKDEILMEPLFASVNKLKCSGCMLCQRVCNYGAIEQRMLKGHTIAYVNNATCQGCGSCASQCPSGVISLNQMTDEQIYAEITGALYQ